MSISALRWAWSVSNLDPAQKLTLIALADRADELGKCWPAVATLAMKINQSERTIQRHLSYLRQRGLISSQKYIRTDGSQSSNTYYLAMDLRSNDLSHPSDSDATRPRPGWHRGDDKAVTQTNKEQLGNRQLQPQHSSQEKAVPTKTSAETELPPLIFPERLSRDQKIAASEMISILADLSLSQLVLDEFEGRCSLQFVRNPLGYLRTLVDRARSGTFEASLAIKINEDRRHRVEIVRQVAEATRLADQAARRRFEST